MFFGVLDICQLICTVDEDRMDDGNSNEIEKLYIIDGQHRFEALKEMSKTYPDIKFDIIIYKTKTYEDMLKIFKIRNLNIKIPDYIKSLENDEERKLFYEIQTFLLKNDGVKTEGKSRPRINVTTLLDFFIEEDILKENKINNIEEFKLFFEKQNKIIKKNSKSKNYMKKNKITTTMRNKCISWKLYIGLLENNKWVSANKYESDSDSDSD